MIDNQRSTENEHHRRSAEGLRWDDIDWSAMDWSAMDWSAMDWSAMTIDGIPLREAQPLWEARKRDIAAKRRQRWLDRNPEVIDALLSVMYANAEDGGVRTVCVHNWGSC